MKTLAIILFFISSVSYGQVKSWYQSAPNSKFGLITEQTINELRDYSPEIFQALDTIGMPVYIKVMDEREMKPIASGLTNVQNNCIFIRIAYSNRSSRTLAHEFGHALYQVTHPEYMIFYANRYLNGNYKGVTLGHDGDDESGKMAFYFESKHISNIRKQKRA